MNESKIKMHGIQMENHEKMHGIQMKNARTEMK